MLFESRDDLRPQGLEEGFGTVESNPAKILVEYDNVIFLPKEYSGATMPPQTP